MASLGLRRLGGCVLAAAVAATLGVAGCDDVPDVPGDVGGGGIGGGDSVVSSGATTPGCNGNEPECFDCDNRLVAPLCAFDGWTCPDVNCNPPSAPGPAAVWARLYPNAGAEIGRAVAVAPDGSAVVAGIHTAPITLGGDLLPAPAKGMTRVFLAKYDADGVHQWSRSFGSTSLWSTLDVDLDGAGNIVLTGEYAEPLDFGAGPLPDFGHSSLFVARFDPDGAVQWSRGWSTGALPIRAGTTLLPTGEIVIGGTAVGALDLGLGPIAGADDLTTSFAFIAELDATGDTLFARGYGGAYPVLGADVGVAPNGDLYLTGMFFQTFELGPGTLTSAGELDVFLARLDPAGEPVTATSFPNRGNDYASALAIGPSGEVAIAGTTNTSGFVAVVGDDDAQRFVADFGTEAQQTDGAEVRVAIDSTGRIIVAGHYNGRFDWPESFGGQGGLDVFFAGFQPNGTALAARHFGSIHVEDAYGLAIDPVSRDILVTGSASDGLQLGITSFVGHSDNYADFYLARFAASTLD